MAKIEIEIERGEATKSLPAKAKITLANLRALVKAPEGTTFDFVGPNGVYAFTEECQVVAEWTETKAVRTRKREA